MLWLSRYDCGLFSLNENVDGQLVAIASLQRLLMLTVNVNGLGHSMMQVKAM